MNASAKDSVSDLTRLDAIRDEDIEYSGIPVLGSDEGFWANAVLVKPERKAQITLRLDSDILEWFKAQGKGYQTRINSVLRAYKKVHSEKR